MKEIRIKAIALHYFKGTENRTVTFGDSETMIAAPNGAGKSTIVDAFFWCMWGKNAAGDQKFSVKTLDRNGEEIQHVDHEVVVAMTVDGEPQTFRRVLVPEYNKDGELKGNHTDYYWNDVPMKKSEYDKKVGEVINENVFKFITSPYYFLSQDWKKQRETLMRMAGNISDEQVNEAAEGAYSDLVEILKTKTLEEYSKELQAKIRKTDEAMVGIPARIDEVKRGLPETPDLAALNEERSVLEVAIAEHDKEDRDAMAAINAKNSDRNELAKKIADLEFKQMKILNEAQAQERNSIHLSNSKYNEADRMLLTLSEEEKNDAVQTRSQQSLIESRIRSIMQTRETLDKDIIKLRKDWMAENAKQFTAEEYLKCPLYGHLCHDGEACSKYDGQQGSAFDKFAADKQKNLQSINQTGAFLKAEIEKQDAAINECEAQITTLKEGYEARCKDRDSRRIMFEQQMKDNPKKPLISTVKGEDIAEWMELGFEITSLRGKLDGMTEYTSEANSESAARRTALVSRLDEIKAKLGTVARIEEGTKRVAQLEKELRKLGIEKTELENMKDKCRSFEVAKMNMITDSVNKKFKIVRWQMFERQVNGEEVPACICLCGGVPWSDANGAGRLNAGIDVAHTLSEASNVSAPMFIDGAECSGNIYNPGGQRILLMFDKTVREMTITTK
jgi:chromosome segregation ATPase